MIKYDSKQGIYYCDSLGLNNGFTTKPQGDHSTRADRERYFKQSNPGMYSRTAYFEPQQIHGNTIKIVKRKDLAKYTVIKGADGLIYQSRAPQAVCLLIKTADCLPILVSSKKDHLIAVVHMGWRGALAGILTNLTVRLRDLNVDFKQLQIAFGPSVSGCCYNIPMPRVRMFAKSFTQRPAYILKQQQRYYLDLLSFAKSQLIGQGVRTANCSWRLFCTHCQEAQFFSYRRGTRHQHLLSYISNYD